MYYCSVDIESLGLNPDTCQMIEFAAVLADTTRPNDPVELLPYFHTLVTHKQYSGEPYAMSMHPHLLRAIATGDQNYRHTHVSDLPQAFSQWLETLQVPRTRLVAAGKNFASFDLRFLRRMQMDVFFGHRVLDPSVLFFDPLNDEKLPDLATCLKRAGYNKPVAHNALEDAQDVIRCLNFGFTQTIYGFTRDASKRTGKQ